MQTTFLSPHFLLELTSDEITESRFSHLGEARFRLTKIQIKLYHQGQIIPSR